MNNPINKENAKYWFWVSLLVIGSGSASIGLAEVYGTYLKFVGAALSGLGAVIFVTARKVLKSDTPLERTPTTSAGKVEREERETPQ